MTFSSLRLAFMGSAEFALPSLAALIAAGHNIACVYAQPPRPAGRGHKERPNPVHAFALEKGLPSRTPKSLRDPAEQAAFAALGLDAAIVAAYGLILPKSILEAPRLGCLNVHGSLLPRWRGAAPIQRAILAGDTETGVTIMQMDEGLDTGAILMRAPVPIGANTAAQELHDALAALGAKLIVEALAGVANGTVHPAPQPETGATYAAKLARDEGRLDWRQPADALGRAVRALNPWPGTWFEHDGERIKVLAAAPATGRGVPGSVFENPLRVACGEGTLRLLRLQRAGRAPMSADEFLRGYPIAPGTRLS